MHPDRLGYWWIVNVWRNEKGDIIGHGLPEMADVAEVSADKDPKFTLGCGDEPSDHLDEQGLPIYAFVQFIEEPKAFPSFAEMNEGY